ncbi:hypothetical protein L6452_01205 [Arctium lappa]|uniref:Uncharacterized protein n=1 Tax=Arctium lappa TaxID=4217 RepID=A0ACB9FFN3_ARCLA|nr:hypothetical protein L6452_01205 [Arctium lappa]
MAPTAAMLTLVGEGHHHHHTTKSSSSSPSPPFFQVKGSAMKWVFKLMPLLHQTSQPKISMEMEEENQMQSELHKKFREVVEIGSW